ncbi:hypothetical protein KUCAC02_018271 [Chaenocephalus aceratus]|uniref:Uncharacterized protein n=1 Tax=Chaenocephalus aceratus TaxID=36190 RepID=A0ACB9W9H8_CHAAC|nr:hypothetical protein KUCAC02_018271 [Chaenocephalus aceratus]
MNSQRPSSQKGKKKTAEQSFVGVDESGERLLFMANEADLEDGLSIRKSIMRKKKCWTFLLTTSPSLQSVESWYLIWCGSSFPKTINCPNIKDDADDQNLKTKDGSPNQELLISSRDEPLLQLAQERSCWNDHRGDMSAAYHGGKLRCYVHIMDEGLCYPHTNRLAPKLFEEPAVHSTAVISERCQMGSDSIIGAMCQVADKTSIKRSTIGNSTTVKERVKVTNSIIMHGVTIEEGCNIQGSVICSNAVIGRGADLKHCLVGNGQRIEPEAERTNEVIVGTDQLMEI